MMLLCSLNTDSEIYVEIRILPRKEFQTNVVLSYFYIHVFYQTLQLIDMNEIIYLTKSFNWRHLDKNIYFKK